MHYKPRPRLATLDGEVQARPKSNPQPVPENGKATAIHWRPMETLTPRQWLYGSDFIEKFITVTVAAGGTGKSLLTVAEAIAMASGRNLLGVTPARPLRVWLFNGEDPREEMEKRIFAAAAHYGVDHAHLKDQLYMDSGQSQPFVIVKSSSEGLVPNVAVFDALVREIRTKRIDVLVIDPLVCFHQANENDNNAMSLIAKTFARLANKAQCSVHLVHHSRKTFGAEATIDDSRGASALMAAARVGRVLNPMSKDEAARAGLPSNRSHFRLSNGKASLSKPAETATWFEIRSVDLGNGVGGGPGDSVGVVQPWRWSTGGADITPEQIQAIHAAMVGGEWRESSQAANWVGGPIATALGFALDEDGVRKAKMLLKNLLGSGHLAKLEGLDAKRMRRTFIVPATPSRGKAGQGVAGGAAP